MFCVHFTLSAKQPNSVLLIFLFLLRYDSGKDGYIDLMELKLMMEKLGAPQTHLGLKNMIKEVDEDFDGKLSFREVRGSKKDMQCNKNVELSYYFCFSAFRKKIENVQYIKNKISVPYLE